MYKKIMMLSLLAGLNSAHAQSIWKNVDPETGQVIFSEKKITGYKQEKFKPKVEIRLEAKDPVSVIKMSPAENKVDAWAVTEEDKKAVSNKSSESLFTWKAGDKPPFALPPLPGQMIDVPKVKN